MDDHSRDMRDAARDAYDPPEPPDLPAGEHRLGAAGARRVCSTDALAPPRGHL